MKNYYYRLKSIVFNLVPKLRWDLIARLIHLRRKVKEVFTNNYKKYLPLLITVIIFLLFFQLFDLGDLVVKGKFNFNQNIYAVNTFMAKIVKFNQVSVTNDGAWCWFADPRAVYLRRAQKKTYVGWVDRSGSIKISSYDYRKKFETTAVLSANYQSDDHDNPSILIRPGGKIMVFWTGHQGEAIYYRLSKKPEDISSWSSIKKIQPYKPKTIENRYTYPNPVQLRNQKNRIFLFWRGIGNNPTFSKSLDGSHWSKAKVLIKIRKRRPYVKIDTNKKDTIHFAFTEAHPDRYKTSIYYMYYKNGVFYKADGTRIGKEKDLPFKPSQADKVYDAGISGVKSWVHDVAFDRKNRPVIVYATFPKDNDHRYHYARWNGLKWEDNEITPAGGSIDRRHQPYYSGGITLDHENPSIVYLSRKINGAFEIEKWTTTDNGYNWIHEAITSRSKVKNVRPISPRGLKSADMDIIWMSGTYSSYSNYRTSIKIDKRKKENRLPEAKFATSIKKGKSPLLVRFSGRSSYDSDGKIVKWYWSFGDGSHLKGSSRPLHKYRKPGSYFPSLTVVDNRGAKSVFTQEIVATKR
jgi:hypothetical protein